MPAYTKEMGGATILSTLRAKLAEYKAAVATSTADDRLPVEYRRRVRNEAVAESRRHITEAQAAFAEWAKGQDADARRRYAADPVGSAADESRRTTNELRLGRLIDSARSSGSPANVAERYAADATRAYLDGRYEEAIVLGTASLEVGGGGISRSQAASAVKNSQGQLDLANPTRAQALADIAAAEEGVRIFSRDINAALVTLYETAEVAARSIGDNPNIYRQAAVGPSMASKVAAMAEAEASGTAYVAPEGALASAPTGERARQFGEGGIVTREPFEGGHITRVGA